MQCAKDRGFWRRVTVTRQQSLAAMQAAARKVKSADDRQAQMSREIVRLPVGWNTASELAQ
ncbi:hypothetical protein ACK1C0_002382 [Salmonella enterica]|nr:hypothetical protein [Salmonella enterica]